MKIKDLESYTGEFFIVCDEERRRGVVDGDAWETYYTDFDEAMADADFQWRHMNDYDKARSRVSLRVSNTARWRDEFVELASCEDGFLLPADTQRWIDSFRMESPETAESLEWKRAQREAAIAEKKAQHAAEMERLDRFMAQVGASSDADVCIEWRKLGYPQPSGTQIMRLKKETGLSWRQFKAFVERL